MALQLANSSTVVNPAPTSVQHSLQEHCRKTAASETKDDKVAKIPPLPSTAVMHHHNWRAAYTSWRQKLRDPKLSGGVIPNAKQQMILDAVHRRCVCEATDGKEHPSDPFLRLVHGLPGSGKSKLLTWMRSYFEDVWQWTDGREFAFLAPLNSMACNIGGATVHGWGRVSFQDKRGFRIRPCESQDASEVPAMTVKEFVFNQE